MKTAIALNSGGLDSLAAILWAREMFDKVVTVSVDYGQRNGAELFAASALASELALEQVPVSFTDLGFVVAPLSALTANTGAVLDSARPTDRQPNSFVPGRNLMLLSIAAALTARYGARDVVAGLAGTIGATPDQQEPFVRAAEHAVNCGMDPLTGGPPYRIHTPFMHHTKGEAIAAIVRMAGETYARHLMRLTLTCYEGDKAGCGRCVACVARAKAFAEVNLLDPAKEAR